MKLIFNKKSYLKLKYFTRNVNTEISGLGESVLVTPSIIRVDNIEIFPQTCSYASTQLDEDMLAKFLHKRTVNNEDVSKYNIWWHSHNDFSTFWSGIDENTIETTTSNPYLISIVVNKKLDFLARIDIFKPIRLTFSLDVLSPLKIRNNQKIKEYCLRRIKKHVKRPKIFIPQNIKKLSRYPIFKDFLEENNILQLKPYSKSTLDEIDRFLESVGIYYKHTL